LFFCQELACSETGPTIIAALRHPCFGGWRRNRPGRNTGYSGQAASSPHSIRALKSDVEAFDAWCRRTNRIALPATAETVADYLDARAGEGSKPASFGRYRASIAKIHQLLDLTDPTSAPLVKLRLAAVRREKDTAQKQARPLRFKGPVRDVERDKARAAVRGRPIDSISGRETWDLRKTLSKPAVNRKVHDASN
jgi:hypothetical protein